MPWQRRCFLRSTTLITLYDIIMQDYTFDIINARFVAAGLATQAKGATYRLRLNKGADLMKQEDYALSSGGIKLNCMTCDGQTTINRGEESYDADYWLGRDALTDVAIKVPGEGILMINDVTVNISLQKEIVRSALVGRAGTIKEYISDGDYQLNMSVGIVAVNDNGEIIDQYPERAIAQLREILERPEALEVSSLFLGLFGITHMVVTGFTVKQMTYSNRQVIDITAVSDSAYVIASTDY